MGNEAQQRTVLKGLQNSVGFLQSKISDRIETRYIPRLTFVMDEGVKKSVAVQQILEQISKERESNPTSLQIDPPVESSDALDEQVESETSNDSGGNP
jgi:ribosome-binding factor A